MGRLRNICRKRAWLELLLLPALMLPLMAQVNSLPNAPPAPDRPVSWKLLVPNVVHDQKPIWLFPKSVAEGKHLTPTLVTLSITAGLVAADPSVESYFRANRSSFSSFNQNFSGTNTTLAMFAFPVAFYAVGQARKDPYAKHTVLLATEAVIDSELLATVLKDIDRRTLPAQIPTASGFGDSWFEGHGQWYRGIGSFPSGHAIAAFSLATIFADRYPRPRWHRYLAFGLAGVVGFSRLPLEAHYASDVFAGAVLGYTIAHYVVLRMP